MGFEANLLLVSVSVFFVLSLLFALHTPWITQKAGLLLAASSAALLTQLFLSNWSIVTEFRAPLLESLGVAWHFKADGLQTAFLALVLLIGIFVFLYAHDYMKKYAGRERFFASLSLFTGSMIGLVLSDNIFTFFLFWELTSLSSFLLVAFKEQDQKSLRSARMVFILTFVGGLALLSGLLWMRSKGIAHGLSAADASSFSELLQLSWNHIPHAEWIFALLLLGAMAKSALIPFHLWLPQAMAAPTPVSSFLHSATMVKAGIFLLAKIAPGFSLLYAWTPTLCVLGLITFVSTACICVAQTDIKKILAYTTISSLGLLCLLLGLGTEESIQAFCIVLFAHALYKAALFQVAGNLDYSTGTRQVDELSGLRKAMPFTAWAGTLAALSSAGAPPFLGFVAKEYTLKSLMGVGAFAWALLLLVMLCFVFLLVMNFKVGLMSFWGPLTTSATNSRAKEAPFWMCASPLALAALGLSFGFLPGPFESSLAPALAGSIYPAPILVEVKLWFGWSAKALFVLSLSLLSFFVGVFLLMRFRFWKPWYRRALNEVWDAADVLEACLKLNQKQLEKLSSILGERSRSTYLIVFFAFLFAMIAWRVSEFGLGQQRLLFNSSSFIVVIALASILAAAIAMSHRNLVSVALVLGVLGASVGLIFAYYGAVDLALTQVLVELLMAVVFAIMISKAKDLPRIHKEKRVLMRLILSLSVGALFFWMSSMAPTNFDSFETARFYQENALAQAKGANTVNVILVDFRALDTLNEALVVLIAALGISALLSNWKGLE